MITFYNELPLDHQPSLDIIAKNYANNYDEDEFTTEDWDYLYEKAWNSIGENLWSEGHMINIPVDKTFLALAMSNHGYENINGIYKDADCQHCGGEWEYQCYECETVEREMLDE